ncbi:MAG: ribonuclease HIII [Patescibacteria group bacterium]|nr:ribonuclease HIII [Patescibacteria group bacterium]
MQYTLVLETKESPASIVSYASQIGNDFDIVDLDGGSKQVKCPNGTINAYNSGKVVIQSSNQEWANSIYSSLGGQFGVGSNTKSFVPHIGVDESGKGDYFGPMVIAAVFVDKDQADELVKIGVRDSKKLADSSAKRLHIKILKLCKYSSEVVISPGKYNDLYKKIGNVNKLLAWGHSRSIENILEDIPPGVCGRVVIDQFSMRKSRVLDALMKNGRKLEIVQKHKGESDIAVAAASVVARGRFLLEIEKMSRTHRVEFPKGASNVVEFARSFVHKFGKSELYNVAKISFKTTSKI